MVAFVKLPVNLVIGVPIFVVLLVAVPVFLYQWVEHPMIKMAASLTGTLSGQRVIPSPTCVEVGQ
jgi:hypothetical protein